MNLQNRYELELTLRDRPTRSRADAIGARRRQRLGPPSVRRHINPLLVGAVMFRRSGIRRNLMASRTVGRGFLQFSAAVQMLLAWEVRSAT